MSSSKIPGEFELIKHLQKKLKSYSRNQAILGIGDDCAIIQGPSGKHLLITTDILLEKVHFSSHYSSYNQIGEKSLLVNISDIAAMGGEPRYAFLSLALPSSIAFEKIDELLQGITETARNYSIMILGGDTNASPLGDNFSDDPASEGCGLVINITLIGEVSPDKIITRKGANRGDLILVTGQLGASAAGLDILEHLQDSYNEKPFYEDLVKRHQVPVVRLQESRVISQHHLATAMLDISDGLAGDLRHLCSQSDSGAVIWISQFPVAQGVKEIAGILNKSYLSYVFSGGEDYELLFTCPPERSREAKSIIEEATSTSITIIGEITGKTKGIRAIDLNGNTVPVSAGFDHFH